MVLFPYQRRARQTLRPKMGDDLPQDGGITGNLPPDPDPSPTYPTNITQDVVPPADDPSPSPSVSVATQAPPPAVDPLLLAAIRPRRVQESVPATAVESQTPEEPMVSRSGQVMDEYSVRPRRVETDKSGRPVPNRTIADKTERLADFGTRVNEYQPQKEPKWKRYLKAAGLLGTMFGGAISHDSNTVARSAYGLGRNLLNPKARDEDWKLAQQREIASQVDEANKQTKSRAELELIKARTAKLNQPEAKPKRVQLVKNSKGTYVAVDLDTGRDQSGNVVQGTMPAEKNGWTLKIDETGNWVPVDPNGLGQDGKPVKGKSMVQLDDGTWIDAGMKYATDRQFGTQDRLLDIENQKATQENARIQANIESATRERDMIGQSLSTTPEMTTRTRANPVTGIEEKYQIENPVYSDRMTRFRQLDDEIKRLHGQIKPIIKAPPRPTVTTGHSKIPAKTNHQEQLKELGIQ